MTVQTPYGLLEGTEDKTTFRYLGIPYAKAPVGQLRFKAPVPAESWEGIRKADGFAKNPVQKMGKSHFERYSEDCLYLNVFVPKGKGENLPVMVWFPGGAYALGGSGAQKPGGPADYDGSLLASDGEAIVVTVTYRINIFGFINMHFLDEEFDDQPGIKDCLEALKWVKTCIRSFGGDPGNITIIGQSAGANAVSTLLMIREAKDLYNKVILQSNCFGIYQTKEESELLTKKFLELLGLSEGEVRKVKELDYETLFKAGDGLDRFAQETYLSKLTYCPTVDGEFVTGYPTLDLPEDFDKPVLIGSNKEEAKVMVQLMGLMKMDPESVFEKLFCRLPAEEILRLHKIYDPKNKAGMSQAMTDAIFAYPKLLFAQKLTKAPVYVYRYDYATPVLKLFGFGCCHIADLIAFFDMKSQPYGIMKLFDKKHLNVMGKKLRRVCGAFAKNGDPNVDGQTLWKAYEPENRYTMVLDLKNHLESNPEKQCLENFKGIDRICI